MHSLRIQYQGIIAYVILNQLQSWSTWLLLPAAREAKKIAGGAKKPSWAVTPSRGFACGAAGAQRCRPLFWRVLPSPACPGDRRPQAVAFYSPAVNISCNLQWFRVMLGAVSSDGSGGDTWFLSFSAEEIKSCAGEGGVDGVGERESYLLNHPSVSLCGFCGGIWSTVISKIWQQLTEKRKKD